MNVASLKLKINVAVGLAKKGLHLFPCHPGTIEPIRPGMDTRATKKPSVIKKWLRRFPEASIGVNVAIAGQFVLYVPRGSPVVTSARLLAEFSKPGAPIVLGVFDRNPVSEVPRGCKVSTEHFEVNVDQPKPLPYCLSRLQHVSPVVRGSAADHLGVAGPPRGPSPDGEIEQWKFARAFPDAWR